MLHVPVSAYHWARRQRSYTLQCFSAPHRVRKFAIIRGHFETSFKSGFVTLVTDFTSLKDNRPPLSEVIDVEQVPSFTLRPEHCGHIRIHYLCILTLYLLSQILRDEMDTKSLQAT